jgi:hypothetical protein
VVTATAVAAAVDSISLIVAALLVLGRHPFCRGAGNTMKKSGFSMRIVSALLLLSAWTPGLSAPARPASAALLANEADGTKLAVVRTHVQRGSREPAARDRRQQRRPPRSRVGRSSSQTSTTAQRCRSPVDGVVYFHGRRRASCMPSMRQSGKLLWRYDPR